MRIIFGDQLDYSILYWPDVIFINALAKIEIHRDKITTNAMGYHIIWSKLIKCCYRVEKIF